MLAPRFVSEVSVCGDKPFVRMPNNGKYERSPCQDLIFVAVVEREHLLHSLPIAVLFAKSPVVSPPVHPGDLVVSIDVRRRTSLRNLTPQDVAVRVVNKPARIFFHFDLTFKLPSLLTFDKTGSLWMSRADISQPSNPLLLSLPPTASAFSGSEF